MSSHPLWIEAKAKFTYLPDIELSIGSRLQAINIPQADIRIGESIIENISDNRLHFREIKTNELKRWSFAGTYWEHIKLIEEKPVVYKSRIQIVLENISDDELR